MRSQIQASIEQIFRQYPVLEQVRQLEQEGQTAPAIDKSAVVVGAGFAGLSAAYILSRLGFDVHVLEAGERVGGRVFSVSDKNPVRSLAGSWFVPGRIIEGGAELIGSNHPLWISFSEQFGLAMIALTDEELYTALGFELPIRLAGQSLTPEQAERLTVLMDRICEQITVDADQIETPSAPWLTQSVRGLDNVRVYDQLREYIDRLIEREDERQLTMLGFRADLENDNLVPVESQSYLGLISTVAGGGGKDFWTSSELFRCANGNDSLAWAFRQRIGPQRVLTECRVRAIELTDNQAAVAWETHGSMQSASVDYLILAVPPCVWGQIQFSAARALPAAIQMGPGIKYLTPLGDRFWIAEHRAPSALDDRLGMLWEGTENQAATLWS